MKKKYFFLQFALVFVGFALPAFLQGLGCAFFWPELPAQNIVLHFGAFNLLFITPVLVLVFFCYYNGKQGLVFFRDFLPQKTYNKAILIKNISVATLCFAFLVITMVFFSLLAKVTSPPASKQTILDVAQAPNIMFSALLVGICLFINASLEEIFYRFYFPQGLLTLGAGYKNKENSKEINKIAMTAIETCCILFFAVGHIYAGVFNFFNAFVAGIILRGTFIKTKNIFCCIIPHFLYNVMCLVFVLLN